MTELEAPTFEAISLLALLERLDPDPPAPCGVPGCVHHVLLPDAAPGGAR